MIQVHTEKGGALLTHRELEQMREKEATEIAGRLRMLRNRLGLSAHEFAYRIGWSDSKEFVAYYERGYDAPREGYLLDVCKGTGARYDWLTDGRGAMFEAEAAAEKVFDLAQTVAQIYLGSTLNYREFSTGDWALEFQRTDEAAHASEVALEKKFEAARKGKGANADELEAGALEQATLFESRGYENGLKYGARLVLQLLTGQTGAEAEKMVQAALAGLAQGENTGAQGRGMSAV